MPAAVPIPDRDAVRHSPLEDLQGLSAGVLLCGVGLTILAHLGLMTGQTAGVAVLVAHFTGWSFGLSFFVVNLPFWWLAWSRMGPEFTIKSLACVTALSLTTELIPRGFAIDQLNIALGTAIFGVVTGLGLLAVFRHKGSLGGLGVMALIIQDTTGFRAGYVQLIFDAILFAIAAMIFPFSLVAWSLAGAAILNGMIAFNHRRDRYIAP